MYQKSGGLLSEVYIHKYTETTYKYLNDVFLLVGMTCLTRQVSCVAAAHRSSLLTAGIHRAHTYLTPTSIISVGNPVHLLTPICHITLSLYSLKIPTEYIRNNLGMLYTYPSSGTQPHHK